MTIRSTGVVLASLLVCALAGGGAHAAQQTLLKVPIAFSSKLPGMGSTVTWLSQRIAVASGGSVKMKIYEPGKLVAPRDILEAVSTGKSNAGFASAGLWSARLPAAQLFSAVPFGPDAPEFLAWLWYGEGMRLYQQLYDQAGFNVQVHACGLVAPESAGWFKRRIDEPAGLKGLRMRFVGLGAQVMQKLGVQTTNQSGSRIVPALRDGTLDATEFSMPAVDRLLALHKHAGFNYFPGWHQQTMLLELLINKQTWNSMDQAQRGIVELSCRAAIADSLAYTESIQAAVMHEDAARGVEHVYWSAQMLELLHSTWQEVAAEQAAKDAYFKRVWEDLSAYRAAHAIWRGNAYLPRRVPAP